MSGGPRPGTSFPREKPCPHCHDLDVKNIGEDAVELKFVRDRKVPHFDTKIKDLEDGGKSGCQMCYAIVTGIWRLLDPDIPADTIDKALSPVIICICPIIRVTAILVLRENPEEFRPVDFELFTKEGKPSPWPAFIKAREVTANLHSKRRNWLVKGWIRECALLHEACRVPPGQGRFDFDENGKTCPKRLLKIGKPGSSPWEAAQLVDTEGSRYFEQYGSYGVIVHAATCPLEAPLSVTTSQNLKERQKSIPRWQIPKALAEAIIIAQEQRIYYFWNPELCVVHDDKFDRNWHLDRQDIFLRRCGLTIALTGITDLRTTSTGNRKVPAYRPNLEPICIPIRLRHQQREHVVYARRSMQYAHQLLTHNRDEYNKLYPSELAAIFGHAQTFQALMLPARVLHIRGAEMVWDCRESRQCECSYGDHITSTGSDKMWDAIAKQDAGNLASIFRPYMHLPTAKPEERLANIAGVMRLCAQLSGTPSHAGIRVKNCRQLAEDLLWRLETPRQIKLDTDDYPCRLEPGPTQDTYRHHTERIPTWSWASMVLNKRESIMDSHLILGQAFGTSELYLNPSLTFTPLVEGVPGGRPDGLLAKHTTLKVVGEVVTAKVHLPPVFDPHPDSSTRYLNFTPCILGNIETSEVRPHARVQPDCDRWVSSLERLEASCYVHLLLLGDMVVYHDTYPERHPEFPTNVVQVGLALSPAGRDYCPQGFGRIGTFAVPLDYHAFEGAEKKEMFLV